MFQIKEQDKIPEKNSSEMEISNLPNKEFQAMVLIMLTELRKRIQEHSENFNKDLKDIKRNQSNENYTVRINNGLGDTEEPISNIKARMVEITQSEQKKWLMKIVYGTSETTSRVLIFVPEWEERETVYLIE